MVCRAGEVIEVSTARYAPIKGGSYVPLPPWIERKKAIVNVKNKYDKCFMWALRSALYPAKIQTDAAITQMTI